MPKILSSKLLRFLFFECRMYEEIMGEDPDKRSWTEGHQEQVKKLIQDIWNSGVATMQLSSFNEAII